MLDYILTSSIVLFTPAEEGSEEMGASVAHTSRQEKEEGTSRFQ